MTTLATPTIHTLRAEFGPYSRALFVPLETAGREASEAFLSFKGACIQNSSQCVDGLTIDVEGIDLTAHYLAAITELMHAASASTLETEYRHGLAEWYQAAQRVGEPLDWGAAKTALASSAEEIIGRFTGIGDTRDGCRGNLHPFNYLYSYISLPPVKLSSLLSRLDVSRPLSGRMRIGYPPQILLNGWAGGLDGTCTLIVENPLDEIEQLLQDLVDLSTEIYELVATNGPLFRKLAALTIATEGVRRQAEECTTQVGAPAQLAAIGETLSQIKKLLKLRD